MVGEGPEVEEIYRMIVSSARQVHIQRRDQAGPCSFHDARALKIRVFQLRWEMIHNCALTLI